MASTSGLVGFWRLGDADGTEACDALGQDPGTYAGGVTLGRTGALAGDDDAATGFDGATASVSVPSATALNTADTFSIEAWVKRGSIGGTTPQVIASKQGTSWTLQFDTTNHVQLWANTKAITTSKITIAETTTWHHIVATKSGSVVKLYLDGKDQTGSVSNQTLANNTLPLLMGKGAAGNALNGTLDEVALYKSALSVGQALNHYLLGLAACGPGGSSYAQSIAQTSGLRAYWRLGEKSGTTACDTAGRNPGAYTGGYTLGQGGAITDTDTATLFNGAGGWVSVPALTSLNVGDRFTIEAWLKRTTLGTAQVIASKQGSAWRLQFNTSNKLVLQAGTKVITTSTLAVSDTSTWHYIAATKSGSSVHLYIDGADVTGAITNVTLLDSTLALAIAQTGGNASYFNGALDDIALYETALSSTAISAHYSLGGSPSNTAPPTISGTLTDGSLLSSTTGAWIGAVSYARQWKRCDTSGSNCQDISGATGSTYRLWHSDPGSTIRISVTATNTRGSTVATSDRTAVIQATAPSLASSPGIMGSAIDGNTISTTNGGWYGTPGTFTYQWNRCDYFGGNCQDIPGATSQSYTLTHDDALHVLHAVVTDTNSAGSASATSDAGLVQAASPSLITAPEISGKAEDGATLTVVSNGTWNGTPPFDFTYQWQQCDANGANCTNITGATTPSYTVGHGDVGNTIAVRVTAWNSRGSASTSVSAGVIRPVPPVSSKAPTISGIPAAGQSLAAGDGTWDGSPATYAKQWQRCDADGSGCTDIVGETGDNYAPGSVDVDHALRAVVTATNGAGDATAASDPTFVIQASTPGFIARCGETSATTPYPWTVSEDHPFGYWRQCESGAESGWPGFDASGNGHDLETSHWTGCCWPPVTRQPGALLNEDNWSRDYGGWGSFERQADTSQPFQYDFTTGQYTLETWFRPSQSRTSDGGYLREVLISRGLSGYTLGWGGGHSGFVLRQVTSYRDCSYPECQSTYDHYTWTDAAAPYPITAGTWYHVVGTWDGATMRLYVNGRLLAATPETLMWNNPNGGQFFELSYGPWGQRDDVGRTLEGTHGRLDEVAVYDQALPAGRILAHYAASGREDPTPQADHSDEPDYWDGEDPDATPADLSHPEDCTADDLDEVPASYCGEDDNPPEHGDLTSGASFRSAFASSVHQLTSDRYGIADNNPYIDIDKSTGQPLPAFDLFSQPEFNALGVGWVRLTTPWNVATTEVRDSTDPYKRRDFETVEHFVKAAFADGKTPLISFDRCYGWWTDLAGKRHRCVTSASGVGVPPDLASYSAAVEAFLDYDSDGDPATKDLKDVKHFTAWNEPNYRGAPGKSTTPYEPTAAKDKYGNWKYAQLAGRYFRTLNYKCRRSAHNCKVAAGDFSDGSMGNAAGHGPGGDYFLLYRSGVGWQPVARWAWHSYYEAKFIALNPQTTKRWHPFLNFLKAIGTHPDVWLTEQGPIQWQGGPEGQGGHPVPWGADDPASVLNNWLVGADSLVAQSDQITRFFYYQYRGDDSFDSGLTERRNPTDPSQATPTRNNVYCAYLSLTGGSWPACA